MRRALSGARPLPATALLAAAAILLLAPGCSSRPKAVAPSDLLAPGRFERGLASWYGADFAGLPTASGEIFRPEKISAAHRTLPLGSVVDVKNEKNGKVVRVAVNDRGPFVAGRIVDLSKAAAAEIDSVIDGVVPVTLTVVKVGDNARRRSPSAPAEPPATAWAVQAGAFADAENARKLKERLAERYPKPWTEETAGLKRVKFGPYRSKSEAEAARDSLADLGLAGIVMAFNPPR